MSAKSTKLARLRAIEQETEEIRRGLAALVDAPDDASLSDVAARVAQHVEEIATAAHTLEQRIVDLTVGAPLTAIAGIVECDPADAPGIVFHVRERLREARRAVERAAYLERCLAMAKRALDGEPLGVPEAPQ